MASANRGEADGGIYGARRRGLAGFGPLLAAVGAMRLRADVGEHEAQRELAKALDAAGIGYEKECPVGPGMRIDFLLDDGTGVEVKRGRPALGPLMRQAGRYMGSGRLRRLAVLSERGVRLPGEILGKPCISVGMSKSWGMGV
ncbi:MAG: hypothetical protein FWE70_08775 [Oscillospiraceae bacterium]|nr:hypothetical protein [Oscillospiraceae bacterium]